MAIGFIVISVDYTKNKNLELSYNVVFNKIKKLSSVKGSNIEPKGEVKINDDSTEIEMKITMNSPHDELSYIATIENAGIKAKKIPWSEEETALLIETYQNIVSGNTPATSPAPLAAHPLRSASANWAFESLRKKNLSL